MAKKCSVCGAELPHDAKFCNSCGAKVSGAGEAAGAAAGAKFDEAAEKFKSLNDTADTTSEYDPEDIAKNKGMAVLAYLSWLVLIPLFAAKESKFARFHTNQGIVLAIAATVGGVLIGILPDSLSFIGGLFELAVIIVDVIGIVNAANGRAKELPVIGTWRILSY